jgi:hypothetical protein
MRRFRVARAREDALAPGTSRSIARSTAARSTAQRAIDDPASLHAADTGTRIEQTMALQRSAGNAAVTTVVRPPSAEGTGAGPLVGGPAPTFGPAAGRRRLAPALATTVKNQPAPGGVADIRKRYGGSPLAKTVGSFDDAPPMFKADMVDDGKGGRAAKVKRARSVAPDHLVEVPSGGRHDVGAYGRFRHIVVISPDWETTIRTGEQEHVDDETLAWKLTWKAVADAITAVADGDPVAGKTDAAAHKAAWSKVVGQLPAWLRPKDASEGAQHERWDLKKGTPVWDLVKATKRLRDDRNWHMPRFDPENADPKGDMVDRLELDTSTQFGKTKSDALLAEAIAEVRKTYKA